MGLITETSKDGNILATAGIGESKIYGVRGGTDYGIAAISDM